MIKVKKKDVEEVANFWGKNMPMMACEEMAECIQAISKLERNLNFFGYEFKRIPVEDALYANLTKEIADVYISLSAISAIYGITDKDIQDAVDNKLRKEY